jgi:hypothetical protein
MEAKMRQQFRERSTISDILAATDTFINNLPSILNSSMGVLGVTFDKLIQHVLRNGVIERNKENLRRGESIQESFQKAKRLTRGAMVRHRMHKVNNPTVSALIKENCDRLDCEEKKATKKKRYEIRKKIDVVVQLRTKNPIWESGT